MADGLQRSLITEAAKQALLLRLSQLNEDIATHIASGLDAHDTHVILNEEYKDASGTVVAAKTLKIGVRVGGVYGYILLPAIPQ